MIGYLHLRRRLIDRISSTWIVLSVVLLLLLPLAIELGLAIESLPIVKAFPLRELLTSSDWSPMEGKFGFYTFIISSVWITAIAFVLSAPVCILSAIYLTQYAHARILYIMNLIIDVMAGIPSVVYGVGGVLVVVPFIKDHLAPLFNINSSGYSVLAGGIVLAIMSIPYMLNMLIDIFKGMPLEIKEASLSLGADVWQTVKFVLIRKGSSGIVAALGLGISKSLGETIAVLMVVGNVARIPQNMFQPGYPLPALLANNYGDMMSIPAYEAALMFAALILFLIIMLFNVFTNILIYKQTKE